MCHHTLLGLVVGRFLTRDVLCVCERERECFTGFVSCVDRMSIASCSHEVIDQATELQEEIGTIALEKVASNVEEKLAALDKVKGGLEGAQWLDGLAANKHTVWKEVFNHAQKTIMKETKVAAMRKGLESCEQATPGSREEGEGCKNGEREDPVTHKCKGNTQGGMRGGSINGNKHKVWFLMYG